MNLPNASPDPDHSTMLTGGVVDSTTQTKSACNQPGAEDDCFATTETNGTSSSDHTLLEHNSVFFQQKGNPTPDDWVEVTTGMKETEETSFHEHA